MSVCTHTHVEGVKEKWSEANGMRRNWFYQTGVSSTQFFCQTCISFDVVLVIDFTLTKNKVGGNCASTTWRADGYGSRCRYTASRWEIVGHRKCSPCGGELCRVDLVLCGLQRYERSWTFVRISGWHYVRDKFAFFLLILFNFPPCENFILEIKFIKFFIKCNWMPSKVTSKTTKNFCPLW